MTTPSSGQHSPNVGNQSRADRVPVARHELDILFPRVPVGRRLPDHAPNVILAGRAPFLPRWQRAVLQFSRNDQLGGFAARDVTNVSPCVRLRHAQQHARRRFQDVGPVVQGEPRVRKC